MSTEPVKNGKELTDFKNVLSTCETCDAAITEEQYPMCDKCADLVRRGIDPMNQQYAAVRK